MIVLKKSGITEHFDIMKIIKVLQKANYSCEEMVSESDIVNVANNILNKLKNEKSVSTHIIQRAIEKELISMGFVDLARSYIIGCYENKLQYQMSKLDDKIMSIINNNNDKVATENSNKNANLITTQRDYIAGEVSKRLSKKVLFSEEIVKAHDKGVVHQHDLDYTIQPMLNCCLVNLEDMFTNGTNINGVHIDTPKSLQTASTLASQISLVVSGSQYGGQTINLGHLVPFVEASRQKIKKRISEEMKVIGVDIEESQLVSLTELELKKEIKDSIQTLNYQWNTMSSSNGQTPFVSLFMYLGEQKTNEAKKDLALLIEEILNQRIQGVKNKDGVYVSQTFPKLLYVLEEDNISEDSQFWYLTELSAKCTAKRLVPDYISEKMMLKHKVNSKGEGRVVAPMGCRSMLSVLDDNPDYLWGRANLGVTTINLAYVALESHGDIIKFWNLLEKYLNILHDSQIIKYKRLLGTKSDVAPTLWQHGALARLKPGEVIDSFLTKEHCTISLGYAGIHEAVKFLTGKSHLFDNQSSLAIEILNKLNEKCDKWKAQDNLGWAVYGTPLESTTERFAKACVRDFGTVDGENVRNYVTNSYHIHVTENVDAFTKLTFESEFQNLSTGGSISYVEVPNLQNNIDAVLSLMKHIYNTTMYAELNCKSDYCYECGFDGEVKAHVDDNGNKGWICPECGNHDTTKLMVVRRTCGYLGSNSSGDVGWTEGRYDEIGDRVLHL